MTLRRAKAADSAKLALVGGASFLETFANDHPGDALVAFTTAQHSVAAWEDVLADPGNAVWLLEEAVGAPIGYAVLTTAILPGSTPADAEIKRIYVLSRWHGTGLGRVLFEAAEAEARSRGAERLVLSVYKKNVKAIRFYEKFGFTTIGETLFPGFDIEFGDFVMARPLA